MQLQNLFHIQQILVQYKQSRKKLINLALKLFMKKLLLLDVIKILLRKKQKNIQTKVSLIISTNLKQISKISKSVILEIEIEDI